MKNQIINSVLRNWKSGITVALVNIPLSVALAIASGATPAQGIITAFWAGLFASLFGGSHYNIVGPTGALSGLLFGFAVLYGMSLLPLLALLSGVCILLAFFFRLDRYIIFIPKSVIYGFTLGIAIILALGQAENALGISLASKSKNVLENIVMIFQHIPETNIPVFLLFLFGVGFLVLWREKVPKFPGAIVLCMIGILISLVTQGTSFFGTHLLTIGDQYPNLQIQMGNMFWWNELPRDIFLKKEFWTITLAVALIAILETLLSGQIADSMTHTKFNRPKEVFGLGIANIVSGLFGGIPATAALARTALNIQSGASHRTSGILNCVFLMAIALLLFSFFRLIPLAIIASLLVFVAIFMVEKKQFVDLLEKEKFSFSLSLLVAFLTVADDPLVGILVGTVIALLFFINNIAKGETEVLLWKDGKMVESVLKNDFLKKTTIESDLVVYKISGMLTYLNMPAHLEAAQKIRGNQYVIVSLRHAFYVDAEGISYLREIIEALKEGNEKVFLSGINPKVEKKIRKENFYQKKLIENKIFTRTSEAIQTIFRENKSPTTTPSS